LIGTAARAVIAVTVLVLLAGGGASAAAPTPKLIVIGVPGIPPAFLGVRTYVAYDRHLYARFLGGAATAGLRAFTTESDAIQAL